MNSIKETLKKANRYDSIIEILNGILKLDKVTLPVHPFVTEQGTTSWRVSGEKVHEETLVLLEVLTNDNYDKETYNLSNLFEYVKTESDIYLHNYSVSLSHKTEPTTDMEIIRCWEILESLIYYINCLSDFDHMEMGDWTIPKGWQA